MHLSQFYLTTSYYLCHKYVTIFVWLRGLLGCPRNLKVYSKRLTLTNKPEEISQVTSFDLTLIRIAHTKKPTITSKSYHLLVYNKRANLLHQLLSACDEWLVPIRSKIHRDDGDSRLLAIPYSCSRISGYNPFPYFILFSLDSRNFAILLLFVWDYVARL